MLIKNKLSLQTNSILKIAKNLFFHYREIWKADGRNFWQWELLYLLVEKGLFWRGCMWGGT